MYGACGTVLYGALGDSCVGRLVAAVLALCDLLLQEKEKDARGTEEGSHSYSYSYSYSHSSGRSSHTSSCAWYFDSFHTRTSSCAGSFNSHHTYTCSFTCCTTITIAATTNARSNRTDSRDVLPGSRQSQYPLIQFYYFLTHCLFQYRSTYPMNQGFKRHWAPKSIRSPTNTSILIDIHKILLQES